MNEMMILRTYIEAEYFVVYQIKKAVWFMSPNRRYQRLVKHVGMMSLFPVIVVVSSNNLWDKTLKL